MTISTKIGRWRAAAGLKQIEAADHVGVSAPVFNRVENGTRFPDARTANLFIAAGIFTQEDWASELLAAAAPLPALPTEQVA